jgi:hypothetical protein
MVVAARCLNGTSLSHIRRDGRAVQATQQVIVPIDSMRTQSGRTSIITANSDFVSVFRCNYCIDDYNSISNDDINDIYHNNDGVAQRDTSAQHGDKVMSANDMVSLRRCTNTFKLVINIDGNTSQHDSNHTNGIGMHSQSHQTSHIDDGMHYGTITKQKSMFVDNDKWLSRHITQKQHNHRRVHQHSYDHNAQQQSRSRMSSWSSDNELLFGATQQWKSVIASPWKVKEHINSYELRASSTALRWILSHPNTIGTRVTLISDSQVAVGCITKGRSSSHVLLRRLRSISAHVLASNVTLYTRWVPSEMNPADEPSRRFAANW